GNVHDSKDAVEFVCLCLDRIREWLPGVMIEIRMDCAFFSDEMVETLEGLGAEFTISVPFERFAQLKRLVQERRVWWPATADGEVRFFQKEWKPKCWSRKFRFIFIRRGTALQRKSGVRSGYSKDWTSCAANSSNALVD